MLQRMSTLLYEGGAGHCRGLDVSSGSALSMGGGFNPSYLTLDRIITYDMIEGLDTSDWFLQFL